MFLVGMLSWWYGDGWRSKMRQLKRRLQGTIDFFSIDILLETFFAPFRQISTGTRGTNLAASFAVFVDKAFARIFGAILRTFMIIIGIASVSLQFLGSAIILVLWPIVPFIRAIGAVLAIIGWMPWI
jgi:hypothetical protein